MTKIYQVKFKASVEKDFRKIQVQDSEHILACIQTHLAKNPREGIPLQADKNQLWRYRVGQYRVLYQFNDAELWVLVIRVAHRKEVYR